MRPSMLLLLAALLPGAVAFAQVPAAQPPVELVSSDGQTILVAGVLEARPDGLVVLTKADDTALTTIPWERLEARRDSNMEQWYGAYRNLAQFQRRAVAVRGGVLAGVVTPLDAATELRRILHAPRTYGVVRVVTGPVLTLPPQPGATTVPLQLFQNAAVREERTTTLRLDLLDMTGLEQRARAWRERIRNDPAPLVQAMAELRALRSRIPNITFETSNPDHVNVPRQVDRLLEVLERAYVEDEQRRIEKEPIDELFRFLDRPGLQ